MCLAGSCYIGKVLGKGFFDSFRLKMSLFHPYAWLMAWLDTAAAVSQNSETSVIRTGFLLNPKAILMVDISFKLILQGLIILCCYWCGYYFHISFLCFLYFWDDYGKILAIMNGFCLFLFSCPVVFHFLLCAVSPLIFLFCNSVVYRHWFLWLSIYLSLSYFIAHGIFLKFPFSSLLFDENLSHTSKSNP